MAIEQEKHIKPAQLTPVSDPEGQKEMGADYSQDESNGTCEDLVIAPDCHHALHRGLKSRHVAMIAIGGSIGYGRQIILTTENAMC